MSKGRFLIAFFTALTVLSVILLSGQPAFAGWLRCRDSPAQYCNGIGCFGDYAMYSGCDMSCYDNGLPSGEGDCDWIFP